MNSITQAYIKGLLFSHFKDNKKVELWLRTENPQLGEVTPEYMIRVGREEKLIQFIETSLKENTRA